MEFTPITTQEEFNEAIKDRLARERRVTAEKYADYDEMKSRSAPSSRRSSREPMRPQSCRDRSTS